MPIMYRITVEGKSAFPLDMLRYDRCYPQRSEDVSNIADIPELIGWQEKRVVNVISDKPPTTARWNSFGWYVLATVQI